MPGDRDSVRNRDNVRESNGKVDIKMDSYKGTAMPTAAAKVRSMSKIIKRQADAVKMGKAADVAKRRAVQGGIFQGMRNK